MIDIRAVTLSGEPIHGHEPHAHDSVGIDLAHLGADALGGASYSLLRGQGINMPRHRRALVARIMGELGAIREEWEHIARVDRAEAEKLHRQRTKLSVWDLVREVGEVCENLAATYTAIRAWDELTTDIATKLVSWQGDPLLVLQDTGFADAEWWRRVLGTQPNVERLAALDADEAALVTDLLAESDRRVPRAIETVQRHYTALMHRVFIRRKHLAPLMDADWGLVYPSEDPATAAWVRDQVADGALVLLDHKAVPRSTVQLLLPTTQATVDGLFELWLEAEWLGTSLAGAVLSTAEHPSGIPYVLSDFDHPDFRKVAHAIYKYVGSTAEAADADMAADDALQRAHARAHDTPPPPSAPMNRRERRAAERNRRRRSPR